jgi:hypothetical protein
VHNGGRASSVGHRQAVQSKLALKATNVGVAGTKRDQAGRGGVDYKDVDFIGTQCVRHLRCSSRVYLGGEERSLIWVMLRLMTKSLKVRR